MYQDALREITEKAPAKFSIYDCMDVVCKDIIDNHLEKAGVNISFISDYIQNHIKTVVGYSILKILYYEKNPEKAECEEYPKGEEPNEDEHPVVLEKGDYMPFILITYGIECFFLREQPEKLLEYIKKMRIPGALRYKKEITRLYNKVNNKES